MPAQPAPPKAHDDSREGRFVATTITRCLEDKGLAARLRRGDNPTTEYQTWDWLGRHGILLEYTGERLPFVTVSAAIARTQPERNGTLQLGAAIARCYAKGNEDDQAVARLRRLLACGELAELCRVLRPVLHLIESRVAQPLDYALLLRQLRHFGMAAGRGDQDWLQRTKTQWAQSFYDRKTEVEPEETACP